MKIFISGPMGGKPDFNKPMFMAVKELVHAQYEIEAITPWDVGIYTNRIEGAKHSLAAMLECDTVVMLPGWQNSEFATLEHDVARSLSMSIGFYKPEFISWFHDK